MKFEEVFRTVGNVPYISERNGRFLYDLILKERLTSILELGVAHGTATCYMAAALDELGEGSITSVDLIDAKDNFKPSPEEQLSETGLSKFAQIVRMKTGYTWFLHDQIIQSTKNNICNEIYDLCIIDGPKNWTIDGAAFFLVDKLLKKDGWIIFDDYLWSYGSAFSSGSEATDGISHRSLSNEELEIPHVKDIFEYLVKQHPSYGNLLLLDNGDWALAQKTVGETRNYTFVNRATTQDLLVYWLQKTKKLLNFVSNKP